MSILGKIILILGLVISVVFTMVDPEYMGSEEWSEGFIIKQMWWTMLILVILTIGIVGWMQVMITDQKRAEARSKSIFVLDKWDDITEGISKGHAVICGFYIAAVLLKLLELVVYDNIYAVSQLNGTLLVIWAVSLSSFMALFTGALFMRSALRLRNKKA